MKKLTLKQIKWFCQYMDAIDLTDANAEKIYSLREKYDLTPIAYSTGVNGWNGGIWKGKTSHSLPETQYFVITKRSTALFVMPY